MSKVNDRADTTIEQDLAELQRLVAWFEGDEFELEQATETYRQAKALADRVDRRLTDIKNTITMMDDGAAA